MAFRESATFRVCTSHSSNIPRENVQGMEVEVVGQRDGDKEGRKKGRKEKSNLRDKTKLFERYQREEEGS